MFWEDGEAVPELGGCKGSGLGEGHQELGFVVLVREAHWAPRWRELMPPSPGPILCR